MTRSSRKNFTILAAVAAASTLLAWAVIALNGFSDDSLRIALRLSARISFMLFLVIFVARPLAQLFPGPLTRTLLRERRSLGIAFGTNHIVHLALIACRFTAFPELEYPVSSGIVGGTAYLLILLMLITSFDGPTRAIGSKAWRVLHKTGLYFVGFVFITTLLPDEGDPFFTFERAWFVVLTVIALVIRMTAWFAQRKNAPQP